MTPLAKICIPLWGLLLLSSTSLSQTWRRIPSQFSTGDTLFNFHEGKFISKNVGWYITQSIPSKIFKTTDGGYQWVLQKEYVGALIQLFVLDSLYVWARNEVATTPRNTHFIVFTTDGGISWDSTRIDSSAQFDLGPIFFFNRQEGFLFGSRLFQTEDGGRSWNVYNDTDTLLISSTEFVNFANKKKAGSRVLIRERPTSASLEQPLTVAAHGIFKQTQTESPQ